MPLAPVPAPEPAQFGAAQVERAQVRTLSGGRGPLDTEDSSMPPSARMRATSDVDPAETKMSAQERLHLPTLGVVARLVAPTLGGALLGSLLSPSWTAGLLGGAILGLLAGLARDREVAKSAR